MVKFMTFIKRKILRCKKELHVNYTKVISDKARQMSFSTTYKDAVKAQKMLDGFVYKLDKSVYTLESWLENLDEDKIDFVPFENQKIGFYHWDAYMEGHAYDPYKERQLEEMPEDYEPRRKSRRYSRSPIRRARSRSRSPYHSNEIRDIEIKIELLRKQRILMEEESKLLLEKRKLEYLQKFGSNDVSLVKFEELNRRNDVSEFSSFLASDQSLKPVKNNKLPSFLGPCKQIIGQMKALAKTFKDINKENGSIFWNLLRASVKKRLTILMEGKKYLPTQKIVSLYRVKHPFETDKAFVDEILTTVKTSFWPKKSGPSAGTKVAEEMNSATEPDTLDTIDLVDLDEFEDMDNNVENWTEDDQTGNFDNTAEESFANDESNASDVIKPSVLEENEEGSATADPQFEDVDETTLIVNDADKPIASENDGGTETGETTEAIEL